MIFWYNDMNVSKTLQNYTLDGKTISNLSPFFTNVWISKEGIANRFATSQHYYSLGSDNVQVQKKNE